MGIFDIFKSTPKTVEKNPTIRSDAVAYTDGAGKTFKADYNKYVESVETVDKAVRIMANVASMAKIEVMSQVGKDLKPLKVKNVDLEFAINEVDSQADFIRKSFSAMVTQGASIIIAEKSKATGFIGFYPYNPARFAINASENAVINEFVYTSESGAEIAFKPQDVIYTNTTVDITNLIYPISRLKPLNDLMTLQANIMKQTNDFYSAGSKDSVIISPKEPMAADKALELKNVFNTFIQSRQTRTMFLNTEVDIKSVSNAQTPADIMKALTQINDIIVESFGIPEYLYGSYAGYVNDAAVRTASRLFFEIQIKPIFKSWEFQLTKYFRNTLKLKNAIVKFNFEDVEILHDSLETKIENATKKYKLGLISINEARIECEMTPLDTEAANLHMLPAYLTGSTPVAIEKYDEMLAAGFFEAPGQATVNGNNDTGAGASGGKDNETQLTNGDKNTQANQ